MINSIKQKLKSNKQYIITHSLYLLTSIFLFYGFILNNFLLDVTLFIIYTFVFIILITVGILSLKLKNFDNLTEQQQNILFNIKINSQKNKFSNQLENFFQLVFLTMTLSFDNYLLSFFILCYIASSKSFLYCLHKKLNNFTPKSS